MMPPQRPSRRGQRPSALDFSPDPWPETASSDASSTSSRKRDRDGHAGDVNTQRDAKRRNIDPILPPARKYERRSYEVKETNDLLLFGEEQDPPDDGTKRIRRLSRFSFFDDRHENIMVPLDALDDPTGDHRVLGAGFVLAVYDIDEDQGQEDGLDEYGEEQYIRTSKIQGYFTRYWESDSPFFIETDHAIYELDIENVSKKYRSQFRPFWRLHSILKFVVSSAKDDGEREFFSFMRKYKQIKIFGEPLEERELWDAVPKLREVLEDVPSADDLRKTKVISHLLSRLPPVIFKPVGKRRARAELSSAGDRLQIEYKGNLDLAVLRTSIRTHVTPRIAQLAEGLFKEKLHVIGPRPRKPRNADGPDTTQDDLALRLRGFLGRTQTRRRPEFLLNQRIAPRSYWLKHIIIDGVKYEVGDTVLFYAGDVILPDPDDLPRNDTLANHFWFARLIHINEEHETVHVRWFEHSSKTILQELGNSQELFLTNICDTQALTNIIGKVTTHYIKPDQSLADVRPHDFFYRFRWDDYYGTFTDVDLDAMNAFQQELPPDNCPTCDLQRKFDEDSEATRVHLGIRWRGDEYHYDDCVLFKAESGTCHIGHIIAFDYENEEVVVRLFGRTNKLGCRPDAILKDERHLFYTHEEKRVTFSDLIGVCYVVLKDDMPDLDMWLSMSPHRFYVKYRFPSINVESWDRKRRMRWSDLPICPKCLKQDLKKYRGMNTFLQNAPPLRTFDPFGGTGAFSLALEESGCFKLTHAVEIVPSTAKTLKKNASAGVKVYNQCSNLVLKHAILIHENKNPAPLKSIEGEVLPSPPKPGEIDCIITGFPCQPHSSLNMYRKVSDSKSNLILTALSYVDHLRPPYCIFENVRGFLQYSLLARQHNEHSVKGGIPAGGLKLVAAALLDMGYQFRCALLQAGHYGTPQHRIRFFLIAAKRGLELPMFPGPTHDFPVTDELEIRLPKELVFRPIMTLPGTAPHMYVSTRDAISDLPKFEWKHPRKNGPNGRQRNEDRVKECYNDRPWCGFQGPNVPYEHEPRTTFQKQCRRRPTQDIQQYTRTYEAKKVERIVEIPIREDADYRDLRPDLWEWQLANPTSSAARSGFRGGFYGRVQEWFQTVVTNVDPTAKQSRVLHPYSRRIVTVRELARSQGFPDHFVFHAKDDRIVTMHRQIGNAIPWPVSRAIAREFRETLYKAWEKRNPVPEPEEQVFSDSEADSGNERMEVD